MPRFDTQKVCLVTGGASGLGRATAIALARHGNPVAIADVQDAQGSETVAAIEAEGGRALYRHVDVTEPQAVQSLIEHTVERFGRLDCAVNNAGIEGSYHRTATYPDEEWRRVIDINLTGVFLCMKHELAAMSGHGGSIVNVGSTASLRGVGLMSPYVASKHALVGLTKTAALEYAAQGIRVNVLCAGGFRTPMSERLYRGDFSRARAGTPMARIAEADEIAQAIVWLCSDESSFVTGSEQIVDGGRMAGPVLAS